MPSTGPTISLADLSIGQEGIVREVKTTSRMRRRLLDLGLVTNTVVGSPVPKSDRRPNGLPDKGDGDRFTSRRGGFHHYRENPWLKGTKEDSDGTKGLSSSQCSIIGRSDCG